MMSRIDDIFDTLRTRKSRALMPFVTGGYPTIDSTREVIPVLEAAGASIVEIGFPFSDPIADGPVIAASMHEALAQGLRVEHLFRMVRDVRPEVSMGLLAMVSQSIIERIGVDLFFAEAAAAGFDGLIIPDLDLAQGEELGELADRHDLSLTLLIAPTTPSDRIAEITRVCRGFIYLLARAGLTGEQETAPQIEESVTRIRAVSDLPIAAGFGISSAEHVRSVTEYVEAAIVGSALVRRMAEASDPIEAARAFTQSLAGGLPDPVNPA